MLEVNYMVEIIGIIATILILISMCFKTTSFKGAFWLRLLNIIGSVVFAIYGILLPAISTAILNILLVIVNTYHLIILIKENKKLNKEINKGND